MKWIKRTGRFIKWAFLVLVISYILFLRGFLMHWGSTHKDISEFYVGDSILLEPDYENVLAVTIDKPPSAIWPWIAQMGLNKGGFYSFTWLENIFGCKLHNADRLHPE